MINLNIMITHIINVAGIEINKINLLNWSILINRGKENNNDFLSNGEWKGK